MAGPAVAAESESGGFRITIVPNIHVSTPADYGVSAGDVDTLSARFHAYQIFAGNIDSTGNLPGGSTAPSDGQQIVTPRPGQMYVENWGKSISNKAALVTKLEGLTESAADMGVTFPLMLNAGWYYLAAEALDSYYRVYDIEGIWVDQIKGSIPTAWGERELEKEFNAALKTLTLGDLFTAALKYESEQAGSTLTAGDPAAAVAVSQVISDFTPVTGNAALSELITDIVSAKDGSGNYVYLNKNEFDPSVWDTDAGAWIIDDLSGYYLIQDDFQEGQRYENKANSEYIVSVSSDITVYAKADAPSVDKVIVGADTDRASGFENAEAITYRLKGTLPENYNTAYGGPGGGYAYSFHDWMDTGLTYLGVSRAYVRVYQRAAQTYDVYVVDSGDGGYTEDKDVTHENNGETQTHTVDFDFGNLKKLMGRKVTNLTTTPWTTESTPVPIPTANTSEIYVEYTAALNENANLQNQNGNRNTVELYYANDPNWLPDGVTATRAAASDWTGAPTGKTSPAAVNIFNFGIQIKKLGEADDEEAGELPLSGAAFALKKSGSGGRTYYAVLRQLTNGPAGGDGGTLPEYAYCLEDWVAEEAVQAYLDAAGDDEEAWYAELNGALGGVTYHTGDGFYLSAMTQEDGLLRIEGLANETLYYLEEAVTPKGYIPGDDVSFTFHAEYDEYNSLKTLTAEVYDGFDTNINSIVSGGAFTAGYNECVVSFDVINIPADGYPVKTGGGGTAPFYIGGGALLAGAALILLLSKVKEKKETHPDL